MTLKPWVHRKKGKFFSQYMPNERKVYYRYVPNTRIVEEVCLGERYAHVAPGLLFDYENYRGSLIDNWHGGPTGSLTELLQWVADAERPEYKERLWMIK